MLYCTKYSLIYVIKKWDMPSIETLVHSLVLDYKYDNIEYNTTQDDQRDHEHLDNISHNEERK